MSKKLRREQRRPWPSVAEAEYNEIVELLEKIQRWIQTGLETRYDPVPESMEAVGRLEEIVKSCRELKEEDLKQRNRWPTWVLPFLDNAPIKLSELCTRLRLAHVFNESRFNDKRRKSLIKARLIVRELLKAIGEGPPPNEAAEKITWSMATGKITVDHEGD